MASPTEMFNLYAGFDPYGAFRTGQMEPQKYDIAQQQQNLQQMALQEQQRQMQQDIADSQKAPGLDQMSGGDQRQTGISSMAKSILPKDAVMQKEDGTATFAGQINQKLYDSGSIYNAGKQALIDAKKIEQKAKIHL